MIIVPEENLPQINMKLYSVLKTLCVSCMKKVETEVLIGEPEPIATITGYWIDNRLRIDIKFKE